MDYYGHGSAYQMAHERILTLDDFKAFSNKNLPLWVFAACDIMAFDGVEDNIGVTAMTNPAGGAVAVVGTTRTVYENYNHVLNKAFMRHVLSTVDGKPTTIGEALRLAKNEVIRQGTDPTLNKLQYSLLGDPAIASTSQWAPSSSTPSTAPRWAAAPRRAPMPDRPREWPDTWRATPT